MMALGWANVGAAIAPDAALASVASAIIMVLGLQGGATDVNNAISTSHCCCRTAVRSRSVFNNDLPYYCDSNGSLYGCRC